MTKNHESSILILSQSNAFITQITSLLESKNYNLHIFQTFETLKVTLQQNSYALLLLDFDSFRADVQHILLHITQHPQHAQMPIFSFMASASKDAYTSLLQLGVNEFFTEPFIEPLLLH